MVIVNISSEHYSYRMALTGEIAEIMTDGITSAIMVINKVARFRTRR